MTLSVWLDERRPASVPYNRTRVEVRNAHWAGVRPVIRAALYVRVSTREQTTEPQGLELRQWAERLGLEIVKV